jgi:hypothetical protein
MAVPTANPEEPIHASLRCPETLIFYTGIVSAEYASPVSEKEDGGVKSNQAPATRREELVAKAAPYFGGNLTVAGFNFFQSHTELLSFIGFVGELAKRNDKVWEAINNALTDGNEEKPFPSGQSQRDLDQFRRLIAEVLLSRAVDSYLTYVSELLSLVFKERPETLRSKEQVQIDFILGFDSMEDLREAIAERRVERLAYRGMAELAGWMKETLGFELISDRDRFNVIERLVEQRNLIVHHRGIIDNRYVLKMGSADGATGEILDIKESAEHAATTLAGAVGDADRRAASKWDLERKASPY